MLFWVIAIAMAIAVALVLLAALRANQKAADLTSAAASDIAVYRDQLAEIERDVARGTLSEPEAADVRIEVSRRLLEADTRAKQSDLPQDGGLNFGFAALSVAAVIIAGGVGLYSWLGAPGYGDLPMKARLAAAETALATRPGQDAAEAQVGQPGVDDVPAEPRFLELMERLRGAMTDRPDDLQGWMLLAENEARLGRFAAARKAQENVIRLKGDTADVADWEALLDLLVLAGGGYVSPEAEDAMSRVLQSDPENGTAAYYYGLLFAQTGRPDRAFPVWRGLLENSRPDAPWVPVIRAQIEELAFAAGVNYTLPEPTRGPTSDDIAAASEMSAEDRQEMIRGMVAGLAERLATEGGPAEDWARLISALGVLGDQDQAREIANEAENVFAGDPTALGQIQAARNRAGVGE